MLAHVLLGSTEAINQQIMAEYGICGNIHTAQSICDWNIVDICAWLTSYKQSAEPH
jgi:hypothetical protein